LKIRANHNQDKECQPERVVKDKISIEFETAAGNHPKQNGNSKPGLKDVVRGSIKEGTCIHQ
jgi:hypothetical protein